MNGFSFCKVMTMSPCYNKIKNVYINVTLIFVFIGPY